MTAYFDLIKPTFIENWPNALYRLSIAQVHVPITLDEARALGWSMVELGELFPKPEITSIEGIRDRVALAVGKFHKGAFIRLGSRSPKDSFVGHRRGFCCKTGAEAMDLLLDASERIQQDLELAIEMGYSPSIFVREWIQIQPHQEFRCFMKDRKLVGISQYHYFHGPMSEIVSQAGSIEWAIRQFFDGFFKEACHLDSVAFDVIVKRRTGTSIAYPGMETNEWQVKLLELGPFFEETDPCLFSWKGGGDFDGSFRFERMK